MSAAALSARYSEFSRALNTAFESTGTAERQAMGPLLDADLAFDRAVLAWRKAGTPKAGAGVVRERAQAVLASLSSGRAAPDLVAQMHAVSAAVDVAAGITPTPSPGAVAGSASAPAPGASGASQAETTARALPKCASAAQSSSALNDLCTQLDELENLQQAGLPIGWSRQDWPSDVTSAAFWYQVWLAVAGWIITGLACTLGAPFWFDALSKLIRLRGSGNTAGSSNADGGAGGGGAGPAAPTLLARSSPVAGPDGRPAAGGADTTGVMSDALNDAERRLSVAEVQRVQRGLPMPEIDVSGLGVARYG